MKPWSVPGRPPARRVRRGVVVVLAVSALVWAGGRLLVAGAVPTFAAVRASFRPSDVELLDRNGEVLHELRADDHQRSLAWVPLDSVSPLLRQAIVVAEDRRFATHGGVDALAVLGAIRGWLAGEPPRGASTITMQLATLLDAQAGRPRAARSLSVKWRQVRRAWALERSWSKDQILEAYLNLVPFRGEVSGVGAAAGVLFARRPHGLSQAESLVLAVLPRAPNAAQPLVDERARHLGQRLGVAAEPEQIAAAADVACAADRVARPHAAGAPHLASRLLRARGGNAGAQRSAALQSTLDARVQHAAAWLLEEHLRELRGRNVRDAAVLAVDNASGDVLAYVGGRGAAASSPHVDGVRARRQAGSTLKPFLYAAALDARLLTAASLLEDAPLAVPVAGGLYQPRNYDDGFRGIVSLRSALASSLNVPAVRTLELLSPDVFVAQLRTLGFAGLVYGGEFYGPALALGSAEVSLEELVGAYRTLANGGVASPLRLTRDAPARDPGADVRVISPEAAFVIADVLADRESRSATFGLENTLATRGWSAVKTGTSKEMRDNWCVGFSRRFTVGVWVGNSSGESMHDVSGLTGAAPIWRELMGLLQADEASVAPAPPAGVVRAGATFPRGVEPPRAEWFLRGTEPGATPQGLAPPLPRIRAPQPGTVIALDPDIPRDLQRLAFEAGGLGHGAAATPARWQLDGHDLGSATAPLLWALEHGQHRLVLRGGDDRTLDAVSFEVRGGAVDARRAAAARAADAVDSTTLATERDPS